jgi:hypothetical protein
MEYYAPKIEHLEKLEAQLERLRKYSTMWVDCRPIIY